MNPGNKPTKVNWCVLSFGRASDLGENDCARGFPFNIECQKHSKTTGLPGS